MSTLLDNVIAEQGAINVTKVVEQATMDLADNKWVVAFSRMGSSLVVANPKDVDFVVLIQEDAPNLRWPFPDYTACAAEDYGDDSWCALRNGHVNIIVTKDEDFFDRTEVATKLIIRLHLTEKHDRQAVHKIVVDGQ